MALVDQIQKDMVAAMKAKSEQKLDALRMIKAALQKQAIDAMKPLDEAAELQVMTTLVKQRKESAEMFRKGNRPELADKEEAELKLIESYMPSAPSEDEMDAAIAAAISETPGASLKQMGLVMKAAQAKLAGKRIDGKALSDRVRSKLS
ncbi:MAG: GatB/YqeY domain-containing protein [Bryobacteraceae bacterium]